MLSLLLLLLAAKLIGYMNHSFPRVGYFKMRVKRIWNTNEIVLAEDEYASSDGDIVILYMMTSIGLVVGGFRLVPILYRNPCGVWKVELHQF